MKRFVLPVGAIALLIASYSSVMAQAAKQDVNITATVPSFCSINGADTGSALTPVDIPVSKLGVVDTTKQTTTQANVTCNQNAHIDLTSQNGFVKGPASPPSGFTNRIDYTAAAGVPVGSAGTLDTATTTAVQGDTTTAFANQTLTIDIMPQTPSAPLVVGAYADVLTVTLTPY